ncbi:MAG: hypothetical protein U0269_13315 [Polyangiales bacterium]
MRSPRSFFLLSLSLFAAGCGQSVAGVLIDPAPPAQFASRDESAFWSLTDARNIALAFVLLSPRAAESDLCASSSVDGNTTTLRGTSCANRPTRYSGTLQITGDPLGSSGAVIDYRDWAQSSEVTCARTNARFDNTFTTRGTVRVTARGNIRDFDVDLTTTGSMLDNQRCELVPVTLAVRYRGTVDFGDGPARHSREAPMRANGTGTVFFTPYGRIETTTHELVFAPTQCATEPASGSLEMRSANHLGLLTYDGATHCGTNDLPRTAPFTLDGVAMGELPVNACSVQGGCARARAGWLAVLLFAAGSITLRLRTSRSRRDPPTRTPRSEPHA